MYEFGEFLYQLRKEKGWTQSELADRLGITNKAVSKWETGESFPETSQLVPLASLFGVSVDELLKGKRNNDQIIQDNKEPIFEEPKLQLKPYTKLQTALISISIGLILVGVMLFILFEVEDILKHGSIGILLGCIAIAVFLLVFTSRCRTIGSVEMEAQDEIRAKRISAFLSLGIALLILAPIPIMILSSLGYRVVVYLPIFFGILAIGIPTIVFSGIQWDTIERKYDLPTEEKETKGKYKIIEDALCGLIMLSAVLVFLLLGFLKNLWHPAWVVFPVGGIVCAIVGTITKALSGSSEK
ncbi:MAG: HTH-type transcriptional regulator ImmR [Firmicutes bacterium ADurb.Bin080]|jgi:transcriptional regulator with XRE-family HTH domain|nr:MAG: HTH-type transcriptional regulator ImmR [Firmicutes bacterium ADurb.Bin080]